MAGNKPRKKVEQRIDKFKIAPPTPNLAPAGKWYDAKNAAKFLRVSPNTLYLWCRHKLIVFYDKGSRFDFNEVDLVDMLQRCKRNAF
jgi:hypothetical protein